MAIARKQLQLLPFFLRLIAVWQLLILEWKMRNERKANTFTSSCSSCVAGCFFLFFSIFNLKRFKSFVSIFPVLVIPFCSLPLFVYSFHWFLAWLWVSHKAIKFHKNGGLDGRPCRIKHLHAGVVFAYSHTHTHIHIKMQIALVLVCFTTNRYSSLSELHMFACPSVSTWTPTITAHRFLMLCRGIIVRKVGQNESFYFNTIQFICE